MSLLTVEPSGWGTWLVWLHALEARYLVSPPEGFPTEQDARGHRDSLMDDVWERYWARMLGD